VRAGPIQKFAFTVALVALIVSSSGCGTYRQVPAPGAKSEASSDDPSNRILEGDTVRLRLKSGEKYSGTVARLSDQELSLGGRGNYGHSDLIIRLEEIDQVEIRNESAGEVEGAWLVGLGLGFVVAFIVGMNSAGWN